MASKCCAYCKRLQRMNQMMETQSGEMICVLCAEEYHMCEICGSTSKENFSPSGQLHYEDTCFQ